MAPTSTSLKSFLIFSAVVFVTSFSAVVFIASFNGSPKQSAGSRLQFSVNFGDPVVQWFGPTVHYKLDRSKTNDLQWESLLPSGGHLVHIQDEDENHAQAYTVTLFHQLKCLDILRRAYIDTTSSGFNQTGSDNKDSAQAQHCLNYLRQSILCHADTGIESTKDETGLVTAKYDRVCRDWTKLYEEAERNQEEYRASTSKN